MLLAAISVALVWKLYQLWRAPSDRALRVVVLFLVCLAAAFFLQVFDGTGGSGGSGGVTGIIDATLMPGATRLGLNLLVLAFIYLLMCFFLFVSDDPRASSRVYREVGPLVAVAVTMTGAMLATSEQARQHSYVAGSMHDLSIALFYLAGNVYIAYGMFVSLRLALQYAVCADKRVALGLRIAALGLLGCLISGVGRIVSVAARSFAGSPPRIYELVLLGVLVTSLVLFLGGMTYPGFVTRLISIQRWLRHRRRYHEMRSLWALLHEAFPQDALERVPDVEQERLGLRGVHRRYYRRVIECRDGLVQLSPYLTAGLDEGDADDVRVVRGADVLAAVRDRAAGRPVSSKAALVACPAGADLDDDVAELVRLSAALQRC